MDVDSRNYPWKLIITFQAFDDAIAQLDTLNEESYKVIFVQFDLDPHLLFKHTGHTILELKDFNPGVYIIHFNHSPPPLMVINFFPQLS